MEHIATFFIDEKYSPIMIPKTEDRPVPEPIVSEEHPIYNLQVTEYPHGGIILGYSTGGHIPPFYGYNDTERKGSEPIERKNYVVLTDENNGIIRKGNLGTAEPISSFTLFLDLAGDLVAICGDGKKVFRLISHNYGKNWSEPEPLININNEWYFHNPPVFIGAGDIVVPVFDFSSGRSFVLIGGRMGREWYPSTFAEFPPETEHSGAASQNIYTLFPSIIHQSEVGLLMLMQSKNHKYMLKSRSVDGGLTWSDVVDINIASDGTPCAAIRRRNEEGNYMPEVIMVYIINLSDGGSLLKTAVSQNVGERFKLIKTICRSDVKILDVNIIQRSDGKFCIYYTDINGNLFEITAEKEFFNIKK